MGLRKRLRALWGDVGPRSLPLFPESAAETAGKGAGGAVAVPADARARAGATASVEAPGPVEGDVCYKGVAMAGDAKMPFSDIGAEDLRSDERVGELYLEAVRRGWWPNSNKAVLDFWCLAEKALQEDKAGTPGRLFHALVKEKSERVSDGQEERAQRRMRGDLREALVARGAHAAATARVPAEKAPVERPAPGPVFSEDTDVAVFGSPTVGYQHSVMMMCFLPQKRLPSDQREYVVRHGKAALQVEAGSLANPNHVGEFRRCAVPFGSRARIILPYINAYAVQHGTREVDLGRSLREFLNRLGMSFDGRRGREVTEQVQAVAAAQIILGQWRDDGVVTRYGRVADAVSFWIERDEDQHTLWEPSMWLSQQYFDVLTERPVPVDMSHLMQLTRSPRRMDLYSWLTYRTTRIRAGKQVRIKLADLQPVFAPDMESPRLFKLRLREDLAAIAKIYRDFKVSLEGEVLVLESSPPPISSREMAQLPPAE